MPNEQVFLFDSQDNLHYEFSQATSYFEKHPSVIKIKRKDWPAIVTNTNPPRHSYLKVSDDLVIAIAHGRTNTIGSGNSARVKYACSH